MATIGFVQLGQAVAREDLRQEDGDRWGDVPAVLTATYAHAPTAEEMAAFGRGYFAEVRQARKDEQLVAAEERRLRSFCEAGGRSACERRFFGRRDPQRDRQPQRRG